MAIDDCWGVQCIFLVRWRWASSQIPVSYTLDKEQHWLDSVYFRYDSDTLYTSMKVSKNQRMKSPLIRTSLQ